MLVGRTMQRTTILCLLSLATEQSGQPCSQSFYRTSCVCPLLQGRCHLEHPNLAAAHIWSSRTYVQPIRITGSQHVHCSFLRPKNNSSLPTFLAWPRIPTPAVMLGSSRVWYASCDGCAGGEELIAWLQLVVVALQVFQERKGIGLPSVSGEEGDRLVTWTVKSPRTLRL
jgi:hypothetical protein